MAVGKVALVSHALVLMNWAAVAGLDYFVRSGAPGIWHPAAVEQVYEEGRA